MKTSHGDRSTTDAECPLTLVTGDVEYFVTVNDLRKISNPPGCLLPENPLNPEHYQRLVDRIVVTHWNSILEILADGNGYGNLLTLRDRLSSHIESYGRQNEEKGLRLHITGYVCDVLAFEVNRHGGETRITQSLATTVDELQRRGEEWWWERERSELQMPTEPPRYARLRSPTLDAMVVKVGFYGYRYVRFDPSGTWESSLNSASSLLHSLKRQNTESSSKPLEIAEFRLGLVNQVLWEYEVLGRVGPLRIGDPARSYPFLRGALFSVEQLLFIVLAREAIEGASGTFKRSTLLGGPKGEVGGIDRRAMDAIKEYPTELSSLNWSGDLKGGNGKARRIAGARPTKAYWSSSDEVEEGDPMWSGDRASEDYFKWMIGELYEDAKAIRVRTVADVALYAAGRQA